MRKAFTILAGCGLALGAAACGKHDDAGSGANVSASDNMLVPADENIADTGSANEAGATADNAADNAAGNDAGATGATSGNAQ